MSLRTTSTCPPRAHPRRTIGAVSHHLCPTTASLGPALGDRAALVVDPGGARCVGLEISAEAGLSTTARTMASRGLRLGDGLRAPATSGAASIVCCQALEHAV